MLDSLYKYLVLNHHAGIPGVGSFSIQQMPASINGNAIQAPAHAIVFVAGTALTDKKFYQFLSHETGYSEVDSVRKFQDFAYQLRKDIQSNTHIVLQGMGMLKRNPTGEIVFESTASADKYFASIALPQLNRQSENVIEEKVTEEIPVLVDSIEEEEYIRKDRWWIWAIVLGVIAIAVIGYFASQGNIM